MSNTELSIEKVSLLLRGLVDVKEKTQKDLPSGFDGLVNNILEAQQALIQGIDNFLHRKTPWEADGKETVTAIINACPEFLHTKDQNGYIPITSCAKGADHEANMSYLPLLANVGIQHDVGGKHGRGGLVSKNDSRFNALQYCASLDKSSHEVMKVLMKMNLPLFKKRDVYKHALLNYSLQSANSVGDLAAPKFYIDLDPSSLLQQSYTGRYPITYVHEDMDIAQYLLRRALKHNHRHHSIGGLISTCRNGRSLLKNFITQFGEKRTWDMLEKEISPYKDIPILHQMIDCAPEEMGEVINRLPHSLYLRDENNRLPIHVALEKGVKWSIELIAILHTNMEHLNAKDPVTGYFPFALAAEEPSCDLRTINYLLRMHPGQIGLQEYSQ